MQDFQPQRPTTAAPATMPRIIKAYEPWTPKAALAPLKAVVEALAAEPAEDATEMAEDATDESDDRV